MQYLIAQKFVSDRIINDQGLADQGKIDQVNDGQNNWDHLGKIKFACELTFIDQDKNIDEATFKYNFYEDFI